MKPLLIRRLLTALAVLLLSQWLQSALAQPLVAHLPLSQQFWVELGVRTGPPLLLAIWWLMRWGESARGGRMTRRLSWGVLLGSLVLGTTLLHREVADGLRIAEARFERLTLSVAREIDRRMGLPLQGLQAMGAFSAHDWQGDHPFSHDEFNRFVKAMRLETDYPGVRGLGWVARAKPGLSGWQDHWLVSTTGTGDAERLLAQSKAWQEAAAAAVRSGQATLAEPMASMQRVPLLNMALPVYRPGAKLDSSEQRQAAAVGVLHAWIDPTLLFGGLSAATQDLVAVSLQDPVVPNLPLYQLSMHRTQPGKAPLQTRLALRLADRDLSLEIRSLPDLDAQMLDRGRFLLQGVATELISLLLTGLLLSLSRSRAKALALAKDMTRDLEAAKLKAESLLRESQALLDTLNQHALVSMADPQGRIIYANDAFCAISGYSREELLGQDHRIVNSGTHPRSFWQDMWETLAQGEVWTGVVCNRRKNGQLYWVKSTVAAQRDLEGRIQRYISVRTDVTTQRQVEEALTENTERLDLALEGGTDGLWDRLDTYGEQEWWSPQFYRLLGLEPGEVESSVSEFDRRLHPDDQFATLAALEAALEHDKPYDVEFRLMTKSGGYRWFRSRAKVFRDEFHSHRRIAGSLQDIHELKLSQAVLREQSERLSRIFALSPDGFAALDAQQRVCYVSPRFIELSSMSLLKCLGLNAAELLAAIVAKHKPAEGCRCPSLEELRLGPASLELLDDKGHVKVLHAALHEDVGQSLPGMLQLRDISRERELDRLKTEFLTTAAHELRTPMVTIYGFVELMMSRELPPEKLKQFLAKIFRQSQVMMNITTQLIDLARLDSQKGSDFAMQELDLCELLKSAMLDFRPPEGRDEPVLVADHPRPRLARVDGAKLTQVLNNVLSNAYKFSSEGEVRIELKAIEPKRQLRIEVTDHGIGMTPEQMARVTERFYRADPSGHVLGTGLGMSIALEILTQMGGELQFESTPGERSTVSIVLPWLNP